MLLAVKLKNQLTKLDPDYICDLRNIVEDGVKHGCEGAIRNPATGRRVIVDTKEKHNNGVLTGRSVIYEETTSRDWSRREGYYFPKEENTALFIHRLLRRPQTKNAKLRNKPILFAELTDRQRGYICSSKFECRLAAAERGWGLDELVYDPLSSVRVRVAEQGYGLKRLIKDPDHLVRRAVAEQGYGLDKLIEDESAIVRGEVANQGYGLEQLIDDEYDYVRDFVNRYIKEHDLIVIKKIVPNPNKSESIQNSQVA